jgi:hypothetical protein
MVRIGPPRKISSACWVPMGDEEGVVPLLVTERIQANGRWARGCAQKR